MLHPRPHLILLALGVALSYDACNRGGDASDTLADDGSGASARQSSGGEVAQRVRSQSCELGAVFWAFDSSDLDERARSTLSTNASCLRQQPGSRAKVVGMTDEQGTEEYNLALGDRRARSAVQYMTSLGVEGARLEPRSVGEEHATGRDDAAMARDRRSDFVAE
jgi:peptidoglycan-associated lipoprotein